MVEKGKSPIHVYQSEEGQKYPYSQVFTLAVSAVNTVVPKEF